MTGLQRNHFRLIESQVERHLGRNINETELPQILLNPVSITRVLGVVTFILILSSNAAKLADYLTGHNYIVLRKLVKIFYVELEMNVPTFFSMLLLLFAALLLVVISVLTRKQSNSHAVEWRILSVGFFYMAFDEIIAVHDRLVEPMREILGGRNLGILYYGWVVPAAVLILFLALFFLRFLQSLPPKTRFSFLIAATLYIGGAIGFEFIGGSHAEIYGENDLTYIILTTIEESLEMVGIIVFIRALLEYIADTYREVEVGFGVRRGNDQNQTLHSPKAAARLGVSI